ncbi:MAG: fimbrial protein [Moraxellaceae bacterium]|nr:fimbrial protein [Moraxellaceae bacterium]
MNASTGSHPLWLIVLALLASMLPTPASATLACTQNPVTPSLTATIPVTTINTVGSPNSRYLTAWFDAPATGYVAAYDGCTSNNTGNIQLQGRVILPPTGRSIDGFPIFATGVPGVGIIVQGRDRDTSSHVAAARAPALGPDWTTIVQGWSVFWHTSFGARLVNTGDTIVNGTVTLGKIGEIRIAETGVTNAIVPVNLVVSGSLSITSRTCSVSTASRNIAVAMGTINRGAFTGVGSTAGGGNFTVRLENCSTGLNLFMTFTDGNNPANTSDVLSLTPGTTAAKGIGIRITRQDNSQVVSYGPDLALPGNPGQLSFGTTTAATRDLAFKAAYVQTQSFIAGGTANALATITMSYQ